MKRQDISLRSLQGVSLISALIAVIGGGTFVLYGTDGLPIVVGFEYPSLSPSLQQAADAVNPAISATFDTWYRALGWYWVTTGLMLFWIIPKIQYHSDWFRFIHLGFMAVGIASLITIIESGTNLHNRYGALVFELGIPCALIIWQWFVAKAASAQNADQVIS